MAIDSFDLGMFLETRREAMEGLVEWLERRSQDPWNKVADLYEEAKQAVEEGSLPWEVEH